jgi:CRP-like cAMP-binding protein
MLSKSFENRCEKCATFEDSLFSLMNMESIDTLNSLKICVSFKKRHILFAPNEEPEGFYCLNRGTVRTYLLDEESKTQEFTIKLYRPGEWVGFRDSALNLVHHSTAECLEDVEACFYPIESVSKLLSLNEGMQLEILKKIARTCRDYEKRMLHLGIKHKHGRLAHLLLEFNATSPTSPEIELKVTRKIIASMIGSTPEFVMRALSDFDSRKWIKIEKKKITIINELKLKKLSGLLN